jgi:hypothetical protein
MPILCLKQFAVRRAESVIGESPQSVVAPGSIYAGTL